MLDEIVLKISIDELLDSPVGRKLNAAMEAVSAVQRNALALINSEDDASVSLLRIGTVFQLFLIDTLASGKRPKDLSAGDWKNIADNISRFAILPDGQSYSAFVFTLYADYIDFSVRCLRSSLKKLSKESMEVSLASIEEIAHKIRSCSDRLQERAVTEAAYVEDCLWLSLEAMIKLLSVSLAIMVGPELSRLVQAVSQLAFEYGRYVLFAKEQALLESYLQNQRILDDQLQREYDAFLIEVQENANRFRALIDAAFSPKLHDALLQSADLARTAGVKEEELLSSVDEIDSFFMN